MSKMNVAVVGLRHRGELMLERLIGCYHLGMNIVCVVESEDGPARRRADACGIALVEMDELLGFVDDIDLIFDLRDNEEMHAQLRQELIARGNGRTHLFTQNALELVSVLLSAEPTTRAA